MYVRDLRKKLENISGNTEVFIGGWQARVVPLDDVEMHNLKYVESSPGDLAGTIGSYREVCPPPSELRGIVLSTSPLSAGLFKDWAVNLDIEPSSSEEDS